MEDLVGQQDASESCRSQLIHFQEGLKQACKTVLPSSPMSRPGILISLDDAERAKLAEKELADPQKSPVKDDRKHFSFEPSHSLESTSRYPRILTAGFQRSNFHGIGLRSTPLLPSYESAQKQSQQEAALPPLGPSQEKDRLGAVNRKWKKNCESVDEVVRTRQFLNQSFDSLKQRAENAPSQSNFLDTAYVASLLRCNRAVRAGENSSFANRNSM